MKKLSHRDLIIALGIAVAVIIMVSSIYFSDSSQNQRSSTQPVPSGKPKPTVLVKKVLEKLASRTRF